MPFANIEQAISDNIHFFRRTPAMKAIKSLSHADRENLFKIYRCFADHLPINDAPTKKIYNTVLETISMQDPWPREYNSHEQMLKDLEESLRIFEEASLLNTQDNFDTLLKIINSQHGGFSASAKAYSLYKEEIKKSSNPAQLFFALLVLEQASLCDFIEDIKNHKAPLAAACVLSTLKKFFLLTPESLAIIQELADACQLEKLEKVITSFSTAIRITSGWRYDLDSTIKNSLINAFVLTKSPADLCKALVKLYNKKLLNQTTITRLCELPYASYDKVARLIILENELDKIDWLTSKSKAIILARGYQIERLKGLAPWFCRAKCNTAHIKNLDDVIDLVTQYNPNQLCDFLDALLELDTLCPHLFLEKNIKKICAHPNPQEAASVLISQHSYSPPLPADINEEILACKHPKIIMAIVDFLKEIGLAAILYDHSISIEDINKLLSPKVRNNCHVVLGLNLLAEQNLLDQPTAIACLRSQNFSKFAFFTTSLVKLKEEIPGLTQEQKLFALAHFDQLVNYSKRFHRHHQAIKESFDLLWKRYSIPPAPPLNAEQRRAILNKITTLEKVPFWSSNKSSQQRIQILQELISNTDQGKDLAETISQLKVTYNTEGNVRFITELKSELDSILTVPIVAPHFILS